MDKNKRPLRVILKKNQKKYSKYNKYGGYYNDTEEKEQCQAFTKNGTRCTRDAVMTGKFMRKIALNGLLDKVGVTNTLYDGKACCNLCWQHLKVASAYGITEVVNKIAKGIGVLDGNEKCIVHPHDCWIYEPDNPNEVAKWGFEKTKGL